MKKILLGSTMLVGAALASTDAMAQASTAPSNPVQSIQPFTVTLRGISNFYAQNLNEKGATSGSTVGKTHTYSFNVQNRLSVFADARADNGMQYGIVDRIEFGGNAGGGLGESRGDSTANVNRWWTYFQGGWGKVMYGTRNGPIDDNLGYSTGPNIGSQFGWGPIYDTAIGPNGGTPTNWLTRLGPGSLDTLISHVNEAGNNGQRIEYYSPTINGWFFAASYMPNGGQAFGSVNRSAQIQASDVGSGIDAGHLGGSGNGFTDHLSALVRYTNTFGPVGVDAGIGGIYAHAKGTSTITGVTREYNSETGMTATLRLSYAGFGFQTSFNDDFGSRYTKRAATDTFYSAQDQIGGFAGLDYTVGPYTVGAYWGGASSSGDPTVPGKDSVSEAGVGGQYIVAPGLMLFGALEFLRVKSDTAVSGQFKNTPTVVTLGTAMYY